MVSIIIPTKRLCRYYRTMFKIIIWKKQRYKNYEVILMNNNSEKKETFDLFKKYQNKYSNFRVIDANYEFNYSKIK